MLNSFRFIWTIEFEIREKKKKKLCLNTFSDFNQRILFLALFLFLSNFISIFDSCLDIQSSLLSSFWFARWWMKKGERKKGNGFINFLSTDGGHSDELYGLLCGSTRCHCVGNKKGFQVSTNVVCMQMRFTKIYCINCANQPYRLFGAFLFTSARLFRMQRDAIINHLQCTAVTVSILWSLVNA